MPLDFTKVTKVQEVSKDIDQLHEVIFALHMPRLVVDGVIQRKANGTPEYDVDNVSARLRYLGVDTLDDTVLEDDLLVAEVSGQAVIDYFTNNPSDWSVLLGIFKKIGKSTGVVPNDAV